MTSFHGKLYIAQNHIYGSNAPEHQGFSLDELIDGKGTMVFSVGHTYSISSSYAVWNEEEGRYENPVALNVLDWTGTGSSLTGFNQIDDGILSLTSLPTEANSIQITIDE